MPVRAGILMWRRGQTSTEVLLAHFGGPYWAKRDKGAWAIPKGLVEPGETAEVAARREFEEELGIAPSGILSPLGRIRQPGGKWVEAFALEGDLDPASIRSATFEMEWPPRSGRHAQFPEIDRVRWYPLDDARGAILPGQAILLDHLAERIGADPPET